MTRHAYLGVLGRDCRLQVLHRGFLRKVENQREPRGEGSPFGCCDRDSNHFPEVDVVYAVEQLLGLRTPSASKPAFKWGGDIAVTRRVRHNMS